jgi:hypothetical protein
MLRSDAIARLRLRRIGLLLKEFLLFSVSARALLRRSALLRRLLRSLHLRLRLRRRILLHLPLRLTTLLVRLVFATTPAAPMSLRLSLAIGLG